MKIFLQPFFYQNFVKNILFVFFIFLITFSSCKSSRDIYSANNNTDETENTSSKSIIPKYAELLGVETNVITNINLYTLIDEWMGTPYKYAGTTKKGIDCSNFASVIYKEIYSQTINGSSASIYNQCKEVSKKDLAEGDLVFFKIESNSVSHVGVYLQNNKFVHATTKKGVMIDDLDEVYYKKYYYKAGRLK